jgi:hypothetical protein
VAKMKFFGSHKFETKGIWIHKGRKKVFLNEKQTSDFLKNYIISDTNIEVFTSKRKEDGMYVTLSFNNESCGQGNGINIERIIANNTFKISLDGCFCIELSDVESNMIFYNGQKIEDLTFSIKGILFGDLMSGGGISRTDMWDAELEDDVFPKIDFEYIP